VQAAAPVRGKEMQIDRNASVAVVDRKTLFIYAWRLLQNQTAQGGPDSNRWSSGFGFNPGAVSTQYN
jgi:hypothetical protein